MGLIRKYGVWLALFVTLAASMWVSKQDAADDLVTEADNNTVALESARKAHHPKKNTELSEQDQQLVALDADIFTPRYPDIVLPKNIFTSFVTAQNNPALNVVPSNASIANPFVYAGKIIEGPELVVFLIDGEKSHAVKSGDVIEGTWKIKSITPPKMTLKNIPLKVEMQMEIGANS